MHIYFYQYILSNRLQGLVAGEWPTCLRKIYCPNTKALSQCTTLATARKIYFTAAYLKNGISTGRPPNALFFDLILINDGRHSGLEYFLSFLCEKKELHRVASFLALLIPHERR